MTDFTRYRQQAIETHQSANRDGAQLCWNAAKHPPVTQSIWKCGAWCLMRNRTLLCWFLSSLYFNCDRSILERVIETNLLWHQQSGRYLFCFVYIGVSRYPKAEGPQALGMKRPLSPSLFSASFSLSAELFSPSENQISLLHSMYLFLGQYLIVPGHPWRLTQHCWLRF